MEMDCKDGNGDVHNFQAFVVIVPPSRAAQEFQGSVLYCTRCGEVRKLELEE